MCIPKRLAAIAASGLLIVVALPSCRQKTPPSPQDVAKRALEAASLSEPAGASVEFVSAQEEPDLDARDWLKVRVVDEHTKPIAHAQVKVRGLRMLGSEGSWYDMRPGETQATTDEAGLASVDFPRWVDSSGRTIGVDLVVTHPEYGCFNDSGYRIAPSESTIELRRGPTLRVSAWYGSRDHLVSDVRFEVEADAWARQDGWRQDVEGRWSTTQLGAGTHLITATSGSAETGQMASTFAAIALEEGKTLDIALELRPLVALRGSLGQNVPRPITNGHVMATVYSCGGDGHRRINGSRLDAQLYLGSTYEAPITPEGTFEIMNVRTGSGRMFVLCDGWVSSQVPLRSVLESRERQKVDPPSKLKMNPSTRGIDAIMSTPPIDVTGGEPTVVAMEQTGVLEVHIVDERGMPVSGASVWTSPNFSLGGGNDIVPWRAWSTTSGVDGVARIGNLPPDAYHYFRVRSAAHKPRDAEHRYSTESGGVTRCDVVLETIQ